jgi:hypothetical protein
MFGAATQIANRREEGLNSGVIVVMEEAAPRVRRRPIASGA